jgi:RimJ/RimL family protein N-acetyltransferase
MNDHWIASATDAHFLNAVANHADVRASVAGTIEGELDLTPLVNNQDTICLIGAFGFSIFRRLRTDDGNRVYDWHAATLPKGRGRWALQAGRAALAWAFARGTADAIIAAIPQPNRVARQMMGALGFQLYRVFPDAWPMADGSHVALYVYALLRKDAGIACQS